jgi:DNA polymerase I-like protein with 3'-5' exonuclease and polymerase domains
VRTCCLLEKLTGGEMQVILPVHDELIIECPRKRLADAGEVLCKVREEMVTFPGRFNVPLDVEAEVATTDWEHKESYPLRRVA